MLAFNDHQLDDGPSNHYCATDSKGEVSEHGVLPAEACFDLVSFFDEASMYIPEEHRGKPLFNERFDWLE